MIGPTVVVGRSAQGRGVFAGRHFEPGAPILRLAGPVLDTAAMLGLGTERVFALQVGPTEFIDLGSPGRYLNHSCDPNAGIVDDRTVTALRAIVPGEEIRFDYSTAMRGDHWTMECRCGEYLCRRVVLDFQHLPPISQNRYLQLGVVQHFIVDQARRHSPGRRGAVARRRRMDRQIIA